VPPDRQIQPFGREPWLRLHENLRASEARMGPSANSLDRAERLNVGDSVLIQQTMRIARGRRRSERQARNCNANGKSSSQNEMT
jgi:hypothetical protein